VVAEVDEARSSLKIAISTFGRPKPVDIEFGQVEKVSIDYWATEWRSILSHG
jgi:transcription antitermination factor NusG